MRRNNMTNLTVALMIVPVLAIAAGVAYATSATPRCNPRVLLQIRWGLSAPATAP